MTDWISAESGSSHEACFRKTWFSPHLVLIECDFCSFQITTQVAFAQHPGKVGLRFPHRTVDRSVVVVAFLGFVITAEINPDEPSAVATCDDLAKETHFPNSARATSDEFIGLTEAKMAHGPLAVCVIGSAGGHLGLNITAEAVDNPQRPHLAITDKESIPAEKSPAARYVWRYFEWCGA